MSKVDRIDLMDWLEKADKEEKKILIEKNRKKKKTELKGKAKRVEELKKRVNQLFNRPQNSQFQLVEEKSALKNFATDYVIYGVSGYDPVSFA